MCASDGWAREVRLELVPEVLERLDLGDDVLELGPGPGLTTDVLRRRVPRLTAIELDEALARRLASRLTDEHVDVVNGDAAAMPFPDDRFTAVLCFTMLHHVPTAELQDRVFAEACRVLRPGGVFAGCDSQGGTLLFRLIHIGDTMNLIDPATLGTRLEAAGFREVDVRRPPGRVLFRAAA